jgi:galactofuranose transport system substrate-binding protein
VKAAGIPVILLDRAIDVDRSLYRTVLASDFFQEGYRVGSWVNGPGGPDRSGVHRRDPGNVRLAVLGAAGGTEAMRAVLATNRDIDVVFAHNDDMAIGAVRAIEAAGLTPGTDIRIVSIDGIRTR